MNVNDDLIQIYDMALKDSDKFRSIIFGKLHRPERGNEFVTVAELRKGGLNLGQLYRTVSPALAFQYVSPKPPLEYSNNTDDSSSGRVPTYFNNLNSWLGQTMQRDCPQVL